MRNVRALAATIVFAIATEGLLAIGFVWCVNVVVASSQEKSALLGEVAKDYTASFPRVGGHCVRVDVKRIASGEAEQALARGWDKQVDGFDAPVVWTPAATSWINVLRQERSASGASDLIPAATPPSFIRSPLVIGMPEPMAVALGWPSAAVGWEQILKLARDPGGWSALGHPEFGAFRLGKTNPNTSTSGLHALYGTYYAAVSRPPVEADLTDPAVMKYVHDVESAVVHYGDTVSGFLVNLLDADRRSAELRYVSAIAMEEKQVYDYNTGNPKSLLVPDDQPPRTRLLAFYPKEGTLYADHPYATLNAPWVDADERTAAEGFLSYLLSPPVQERFKRAGFRDQGGVAGPEISQRYGLLPDQPRLTHNVPQAALLERMQRSWADLRKRAHLILVIDVSAAMGERIASGGIKLDQAKVAANAALEELATEDDVGLWVFSSALSSTAPYREISGLGPLASRREELRGAIDALQPDGGNPPLFATARAGVRQVTDRFDRTRINALMLLTSGRNVDPDDDLVGLQRDLLNQDEDHRVRIFAMSYGSAADFDTVGKLARASGGIGYNALDPTTTIRRVIEQMLSNF